MKYRITRVTVRRKREGKDPVSFSFKVDHRTNDLKAYKSALKSKYQATSIHIDYSEIV